MASEVSLLTGWGRTPASSGSLHRPEKPSEVEDLLRAAGSRGLIPRGLGRSYGDVAQNAGGLVVDMTALDAVLDVDLEAGMLTCLAGTSLDTLMRALVPLGWFVPVTPGTRHVTVGGAIAADIHGKNHHQEGSFCDHVRSFELLTPSGEIVGAAAGDDVFEATAGGMGLTGIIREATLSLLPVETSLMRVDTERARDLDDLMARMEARDDDYRYSVAWIDCLATGSRLGRGVLTRGDHARLEDLPAKARRDPRAFAPRSLARVPSFFPTGLVNRLSIRAFNELWFRRAPQEERGGIESITAFFHPLDALADWPHLYGPRGFLQYQFAVPFGEERTVQDIVERLAARGVASFLAVLKRFGRGRGLLSFPLEGWTLALDMPAGLPELGPFLDELDDLVVAAGGRVYLAKDSRLRPDPFRAMYPELDRFARIRERLDPSGRLVSDLARRVGLV